MTLAPHHHNPVKPFKHQRYALPGVHAYDPPYSWMTPTFPYPRSPLKFESETRAPGTGLWWGPPGPGQPLPSYCPPYPYKAQSFYGRS